MNEEGVLGIDSMILTIRAYNVLKRSEIGPKELQEMTARQLLSLKLCGKTVLAEIRSALLKEGLYLKGEKPGSLPLEDESRKMLIKIRNDINKFLASENASSLDTQEQ